MNHNMDRFAVRVTAKQINRRNITVKVILVVLLICVLLLGIGYGLSLIANMGGNFTVLVPPENSGALSLCNTPDFSNPTSCIEAEAVESMDNITKSWMPDDLDTVDGSHNGDNYIAQTFYLKNVSDKAIDYLAEINIHSASKGADEAMRVMIIKNGTETVYAKAKVGSSKPEPDTVMFAGNTKVLSDVTESFEAGATDKYTVVIWLEGNDPECVDNIKGGVVKMSMKFSVIDDTAFT